MGSSVSFCEDGLFSVQWPSAKGQDAQKTMRGVQVPQVESRSAPKVRSRGGEGSWRVRRRRAPTTRVHQERREELVQGCVQSAICHTWRPVRFSEGSDTEAISHGGRVNAMMKFHSWGSVCRFFRGPHRLATRIGGMRYASRDSDIQIV